MKMGHFAEKIIPNLRKSFEYVRPAYFTFFCKMHLLPFAKVGQHTDTSTLYLFLHEVNKNKIFNKAPVLDDTLMITKSHK